MKEIKAFTISQGLSFFGQYSYTTEISLHVVAVQLKRGINLGHGVSNTDIFVTLLGNQEKLFQVHGNSQTQPDVSSFVYRLGICKFPALTVIIMDSGKFVNLVMSVHSLLSAIKWALTHPKTVLCSKSQSICAKNVLCY